MGNYSIYEMKQYLREGNISLLELVDFYDSINEDKIYYKLFDKVLDELRQDDIEKLFNEITGEDEK